jgi:hypothetical protein
LPPQQSWGVSHFFLEIQFDGFNFVYDANVSGGAIFDATSSSGGTGDPGQADPLDTMNFKVDGVLVGSLNTNIFADLSISGIGPIPIGESVNVSCSIPPGCGTFDLLTNTTTGYGLALDVFDATISHITALGSLNIAVVGAGASAITTQDLPFGLAFDEFETVTFSFISTNFTTTDDGSNLTSVVASGNGNVTGTLIPIPPAVWLLGSGLVGLAGIARRRNAA